MTSTARTINMAIDTIRRYIWLLNTLDRLEYAEFETIQEKWMRSGLNEFKEELPKRTFRNHITAISDQLGIDIVYRKGWGYHLFNPEDMNESKAKQWLISTLSTYNTLMDCQDIKGRILFENVPSSQKHFDIIVQAMRDGKTVSFMYQSHFSNEPHIVEVEPYCIKLFKQRWYLLANYLEAGELRIYALERMTYVDITCHDFTMPEDFDADDYFSNYYGIMADGKPENIKLKVIPLEAKYMRCLPIHHSQKEIKTTDEYSIFTLFLAPTWDFKQDLLSRADQVEVLEPESLREWMKEMIKNMNKNYLR